MCVCLTKIKLFARTHQNNSHDCVHLELPLTTADLAAVNLQKAAPVLQVISFSCLCVTIAFLGF